MNKPYGFIHKWREVIPGAFMCIPQGPMVECDDTEWLRNLYREIGLDPDLVKESVNGARDKVQGLRS